MKAMRILAGVVVALGLGACGLASDDAEELGHTAGDVMASLDETGTGGGFAWNVAPLDRPGFDRSATDLALDLLLPSAHAATCWGQAFSACTASVRTKDFGGCTLGRSTLTGTVTLTFSEPTCLLLRSGAAVTRTADFTLTGPRDATITVSSPGGGQKVTRTQDGYTYTVLGMERVGKDAKGKTLFDIATRTTEDLVVVGLTRGERELKSGKLVVEHKVAGYSTTLQPEGLKWNGSCNCPVSGKLTGSIAGGKHDGKSASIEFTSCGSGNVTLDGEVTPVAFDRCSAL